MKHGKIFALDFRTGIITCMNYIIEFDEEIFLDVEYGLETPVKNTDGYHVRVFEGRQSGTVRDIYG
ncbi:hypothetical protein E2C01_029102 [Portunus trituberculatus]|uniref:Uncharacterized protein n=1 Tax=Portunus trituberculatus TaxID=210409 RepID=A0A5B7ERX6_PORTR|nr:hypothetical protein [Portunus trituberculatus]